MAQISDKSPNSEIATRLRAASARALEEARLRLKARSEGLDLPPETGGPKGPEPIRYGDWDVKGRASDF